MIQGEGWNLGLIYYLNREGEEEKYTHGKTTSRKEKQALMRIDGIFL